MGKNRSIIVFRHYFNVKKGHIHIFEIDDKPDEKGVIISEEI